jgi:hypothetical protein
MDEGHPEDRAPGDEELPRLGESRRPPAGDPDDLVDPLEAGEEGRDVRAGNGQDLVVAEPLDQRRDRRQRQDRVPDPVGDTKDDGPFRRRCRLEARGRLNDSRRHATTGPGR